MSDYISRQAAIDTITAYPHGDVWNVENMENMVYEIKNLSSAQPEIIRCKDCKYWVPGYITDNDDFIPPKCGEWQQMVGHSSDDYCSLAERREVTNGN